MSIPRDASYPPAQYPTTIVAGLVATDAETGVILHQSGDILRWAIENREGPIVVEDGTYRVGKVDQAKGGLVTARNKHGAVIQASNQDTISFPVHGAIQPLTLRGFRIEVSPRAGIINSNKDHAPLDLNIEHCLFDGGYDHSARSGLESKWGMQVYRWRGYAAYCVFENIKREHGIYDHSSVPDENGWHVILECEFRRCGRTGYQHVGRERESGHSDAVLKVTDCVFEDCGLRDGGSHLTIQGVKAAIIKGCESYIGRDEEFAAAWLEANPGEKVFGRGHFVNWPEYHDNDDDPDTPNTPSNAPSDLIAFQDWKAWTRPGNYGRAPAMEIKNTTALNLSGRFLVAEPWSGVSVTLSPEAAKGLELGDELDMRVMGSVEPA